MFQTYIKTKIHYKTVIIKFELFFKSLNLWQHYAWTDLFFLLKNLVIRIFLVDFESTYPLYKLESCFLISKLLIQQALYFPLVTVKFSTTIWHLKSWNENDLLKKYIKFNLKQHLIFYSLNKCLYNYSLCYFIVILSICAREIKLIVLWAKENEIIIIIVPVKYENKFVTRTVENRCRFWPHGIFAVKQNY